MAARKKPSYVAKVASDGRNYYTEAFKAAAVADILTGRNTAAGIARAHKLHPTVVRKWLKRAAAVNYGQATPNYESASPPNYRPEQNGRTLLEKAMEAPTAEPVEMKLVGEYIDLAVAFCEGRVSYLQVRKALGRPEKRFNITTWLGRVFMGAVKAGRVK